MKLKLILSLVAVTAGILIISPSAYAQMGMMGDYDQDQSSQSSSSDTDHTQSVDTILQEILSSQNVTTVQQLDLSKVTDDQWEQLGDAVMEMYHPGAAHEAMDQMMGGEGSESLRLMHINMGKNYLGFGQNYGPGMMGYSYNNRSPYPNTSYYPMMGNYGYGHMGYWPQTSGINQILYPLTLLGLITFFASGTYFFIKKSRQK